MTAKCIMVLGTSSGAGKSWITTALCRIYAQHGYKVAPFKAQNMSNNARVVGIGNQQGEIGSAQYFQALAANAEPIVQMNPVLLKPETDNKSQVILLGKVNQELSQVPWRERSEKVWPSIKSSLDWLIERNDIVVIEGAGSPAEINLMSSDIVNMRVARYVGARCLIVSDIDRGGAFAHLYGTWMLLGEENQSLISGFLLNKFRGDTKLLSPGPEKLRELCGVPVVAVVPMLPNHGLPEEDGVFDAHFIDRIHATFSIAIVVYPHISNLDEFQALKNISNINLLWVRDPSDIRDVDLIILPGSKHTSSDLDWLKKQNLDRYIFAHSSAGKSILGICGGLQMLGYLLEDPYCIDGAGEGIQLLPIKTCFEKDKLVKKSEMRFTSVPGLWKSLSFLNVSGYEIHHGKTEIMEIDNVSNAVIELLPNCAWINAQGNVLGIYLHGLFENENVIQALFGSESTHLHSIFDGLAQHLQQSITVDPDYFQTLIQ